MSALYLSRVELSDFRTFGRFALDIPAGPGLTLLVGTNGLGKSNFFDGIEWCLTNEVRRFSKHISNEAPPQTAELYVGGSGRRFMTGSGRTSPKWTA